MISLGSINKCKMKITRLLKGFLKGKIRRVYKLLLSNSSIARKYLRKPATAGSNSFYCYSIWMRHLKYWSLVNNEIPNTVIEIGPGNSLGVGIAALISGSNKLYTLERTQYWNNDTNIRVFDELVGFFKMKKETEQIKENTKQMSLKKLDFPSQILSKNHMIKCLNEDRLKKIRKELLDPFNPNNAFIQAIIPWENTEQIESDSVDFIFSHTVLQHIDNLSYVYRSMSKWLKKGGCISHKIDFKSMNTTRLWNQHWTLNDLEWGIVTGQTNLINRAPLSSHLKLIEDNNLEIIYEISELSENELKTEDLSEAYKHLDTNDLTTSGYYYFAQL